jgi:hypothetical protein
MFGLPLVDCCPVEMGILLFVYTLADEEFHAFLEVVVL